MKKVLLAVLCSTSLLFGQFNSEALAEDTTSVNLAEIESVVEQSPNIDMTTTEELPAGTEFLNFDSIEEFKEFTEEWDTMVELDSINEVITDYPTNDPVTTPIPPTPDPTDNMSNPYPGKYSPTGSSVKNGTSRIQWPPVSLNPLKSIILPLSWWIDFTYDYTGSGSSKKFSKIKIVKSASTGFPSGWHQSTYSTSFYDNNKGVKIKIQGYHLLGVNIAGQSIGAKFSDTATKSYHF